MVIISRKKFLKNISKIVLLSSLKTNIISCLENNSEKQNLKIPTPTSAQLHWQDFELGIVFHFDLDVYMPGGHHHERSRREIVDINLYQPQKLDTDQWLEAAQAMGARYAIFTTTNHQGFLQWQSDLYSFGLKQIKWRDGKGDIVQDFVNSCAKIDIKPGIYIGTRFNVYWGVYNYHLSLFTIFN
jgi:alpha-L-fucosidase